MANGTFSSIYLTFTSDTYYNNTVNRIYYFNVVETLIFLRFTNGIGMFGSYICFNRVYVLLLKI